MESRGKHAFGLCSLRPKAFHPSIGRQSFIICYSYSNYITLVLDYSPRQYLYPRLRAEQRLRRLTVDPL